MIRYVALATALCYAATAQAEIQIETECYVHVPPGKSSKPIRMIFRRYIDQELKQEVGSFVQYNDKKDIIPLVFGKHVSKDIDSPDLGNYEDSRTEIVGGKVAGVYTFVQTGAGIAQGKYVRYTNAKTGESVTLQHTGAEDSSCKVNR